MGHGTRVDDVQIHLLETRCQAVAGGDEAPGHATDLRLVELATQIAEKDAHAADANPNHPSDSHGFQSVDVCRMQDRNRLL